MHLLIFKLSLIIFLLVEITSCQIKKKALNSNHEYFEKEETVRLEFEILTDEIYLGDLKKIKDFKEKIRTYLDFEIIATLKQINKTTENITLDNLIIYEHFEITNVKKENKENIIQYYDYTPIFDPENYELNEITYAMPNEFSIDTMDLVHDFRFYLSNSDTLLIRMKKNYFEKVIYSNWDTLIVK